MMNLLGSSASTPDELCIHFSCDILTTHGVPTGLPAVEEGRQTKNKAPINENRWIRMTDMFKDQDKTEIRLRGIGLAIFFF